MDPFRNEHEASRERIAQLEREKEELELRNRELERQLHQKRAASHPLRPARLAIFLAIGSGVLAMAAIVLGVGRRACIDLGDDLSAIRGVMIAPRPGQAPANRAPSPYLDKVPVPFEPPKLPDASTCVCAQGDPLCGCL
ncbi:hypothetical protein [Pendulispora albinea]|uniref:Uncharacterized protein n=1 Tax=Pendulispora albinea TaxID=2741071 RepID=A0ABZ2M6Z5_9BACT